MWYPSGCGCLCDRTSGSRRGQRVRHPVLLLVNTGDTRHTSVCRHVRRPFAQFHVLNTLLLGHFKRRFTHSMPRPCRSPAMPCRQEFRMCLFHLLYTVRPCLIYTWDAAPMPCSDHAVLLKATAQRGRLSTAALWPWEERHGQSMAWARHGKCESDTAALCKSNGKDTF